MNRLMKMKENDMVATALFDLKRNEVAHIYSPENKFLSAIIAKDDIPYGNKIALHDINAGELIVKCGGPIGESTHPIGMGRLVHVHNVKSTVVDIPPSFKREIMRQMNIEPKEVD